MACGVMQRCKPLVRFPPNLPLPAAPAQSRWPMPVGCCDSGTAVDFGRLAVPVRSAVDPCDCGLELLVGRTAAAPRCSAE